jgi:hypothetical protein
MRTALALLLLLLAAAAAWLAYQTLSSMMAAPTGASLSAGGMRGLAFGLTLCALTMGVLWVAIRALRQPRS